MEQAHVTKHKLTLLKPEEIGSRHHDIGKFFSSLPPIILFALMVISYTLVVALGVFIGSAKYLGYLHIPESPIETAVASVFGLLAFILGFTFSLTWSRFANRNALVIQQAQAINVCYLRTSLITDRQKLEIRKLLKEYVHVLLTIQRTPDVELQRSLIRMEELHDLIWRQVATLPSEEIDSEMRSLFVSSVNELFSISAERKTVALMFRIPDIIWGSVLFLAFVGMLAFGYQAGASGMNKLIQLPWLPVAFGLVIVLIADLNSTSIQRHFKVTQQPLRDVMAIMERDIP